MKTVLLFSGGIDSTVLLARLLSEKCKEEHKVCCVSIDYGQRHHRELMAARNLAREYDVPLRELSLPALAVLFGVNNTQTGDLRPEGAPASQTVVPNRNMVMIALAGAHALNVGASAVAIACHAGDHATYADCRSPFLWKMCQALELATEDKVELMAPFRDMSKPDIVALGKSLGAPLSRTYSCYAGEEPHCGRCAACLERQSAFAAAQVRDPTCYRTPNLGVLPSR